jgi:hypothetical protein
MAMAAGEGPVGPASIFLKAGEGRGEEMELRGGLVPVEEEVEFELRTISDTGDPSTSASAFS